MRIPKTILLFLFYFTLITSCKLKKNSTINLIPVLVDKQYQYINQEGKIVINPQFSEATIFRDGLALVKSTGDKSMWGFINEDGKYIIQPKYKYATVFNEGLAWVVSENGAPACIDTKGEIKFTLAHAEEVSIFSEGLAAYKEINTEGKEKWGFVDIKGKIKINAQFSDVLIFTENKCAVANENGKYGFIDRSGKIIIDYQFDFIKPFNNNKSIVEFGEKYGIIDSKGKYILNPQYSSILEDGNMFLIGQDNKRGWVDNTGKIIINPQFEEAYPFFESQLAPVKSGETYGYINREGKITINPQFEESFSFNGNLALISSAKKIGFINKEGKYVVNPQYDGISIDYLTSIIMGNTIYTSLFLSVETDFFNINAITARINIESPEGLTYNSTFYDVLQEFEKTQDNFNKYSTENKLLDKEKITNDATLDFYVLGSAWSENSNYDYTFNSNSIPSGFAYVINLIGKGYGKENDFLEAFKAKLNGYTKESYPDVEVFKNKKQEISIRQDNIGIVIILKPSSSNAITNNTNSNNSSQGNSQESEVNSYFKVITNKSYFYNNPNENDRRNAYLVNGEVVYITKSENGFGYTEHINNQNQTTTGWIKLSDLTNATE